MSPLTPLLTHTLSRNRIWFTREEALKLLPAAQLTTELSQLVRKRPLPQALTEHRQGVTPSNGLTPLQG